MSKLPSFLRKLIEDRFSRYLIISLAILGVVLITAIQRPAEQITVEGFEVHFFYLPTCSHCEEQAPFNEELVESYPSITLISHDASNAENYALLLRTLNSASIDNPSFPVTSFGGLVFNGWESEGITGLQIREALEACLTGNCPGAPDEEPVEEVTLPFIGKIIVSDYSLPSLAIVLGVADGFNPCAMWVLVYLISLVVTLNDKRRIWLLVGSFVFASGVLYFLFMTAWLNAFLLIGYSAIMTTIIGLVALGAGILNVKEFIVTKGAIVCEVVGEESRKKTMSRVERVILSPMSIATIAGIIGLAFVVNSIEFLCSAALPAVFTGVLAISDISNFQYYAYILLYVVFFMIDDLIIFGTAAFAVNSSLGDRYVKYSKPVGGTIMLVLGALLIFAPNLLR
ncbi:hypothetical protein ACFLUH_02280 [Chloroflexota bacterium]